MCKKIFSMEARNSRLRKRISRQNVKNENKRLKQNLARSKSYGKKYNKKI